MAVVAIDVKKTGLSRSSVRNEENEPETAHLDIKPPMQLPAHPPVPFHSLPSRRKAKWLSRPWTVNINELARTC
jgi:hypothetical protein